MDLKENLIRVLEHNRPDHVPYWTEGGMFQVYHGIVNRALEDGLDSWGVGWELRDPRLGTLAAYPAIRSLDDIKHYQPPDPTAKGLFDEAIKQLDGIDREEHLVFGYNLTRLQLPLLHRFHLYDHCHHLLLQYLYQHAQP